MTCLDESGNNNSLDDGLSAPLGTDFSVRPRGLSCKKRYRLPVRASASVSPTNGGRRAYIDFQELKSRVSIEQAIQLLGLNSNLPATSCAAPVLPARSAATAHSSSPQTRACFIVSRAKPAATRLRSSRTSKPARPTKPPPSSTAQVPVPVLYRTVSKNGATVPQTDSGKRQGFDPAAYVARLDPKHPALPVLTLLADTLRDMGLSR